MASGRTLSIKVFTILLTLTLVLGSAVGGTLSWLLAKSNTVTNTFTYGDISIDLDETETDLDDDEDSTTNQYEMIPGEIIKKNPTVSVNPGSETCWLFVKLEKSDNFDDFMEYEIGDGWTQLKDDKSVDVEGVYFLHQAEVAKDAPVVKYPVLLDDEVAVKASVTKMMLNDLDKADPKVYPELKVTAYAVQYSSFETKDDAGEVVEIGTASDEQKLAAAWNAWTEICGYLESQGTNP